MTHEPEDRDEWDRKQVGEEGQAPPSSAADDETWKKQQMERDQPSDADDTRTPEDAHDSGPLSGDGQAGGESHWERSEKG